MGTPIRAVLFDLDGTLLPLDFDRFLARYLKRLGAWFRDAAGLEIVAPSMAAVPRMLENDGRRSNADVFWSAAAPQLGADRATLERLYGDFVLHEGAHLGEGVTPDPSARAVVEACRAAGRRVALATNPVFPRCMIGERARWAGRALDPSIVGALVRERERVLGAAASDDAFVAALAAEPEPRRMVDDDGVDEGLRAMAHFSDIKCRFTRGHSTGVSTLASAAARRLGLGAELERALARAGLVHDLGRVATSAAIWDKALPLTDTEREAIRLHSYVGERVLARAPSLTSVAEIATVAHERLDGTGYHRRLSAASSATAARVLAAADVYQAMREARPHRAALDADRAASELGAMAKRGELCPDAVTAVLGAAGHAVRSPERPSGLTDRELEVLRLLVQGLTNKEIGTRLDISTKTAGHHVQHVLEKLGVTTRAAATMIAMRAGIACV